MWGRHWTPNFSFSVPVCSLFLLKMYNFLYFHNEMFSEIYSMEWVTYLRMLSIIQETSTMLRFDYRQLDWYDHHELKRCFCGEKLNILKSINPVQSSIRVSYDAIIFSPLINLQSDFLNMPFWTLWQQHLHLASTDTKFSLIENHIKVFSWGFVSLITRGGQFT